MEKYNCNLIKIDVTNTCNLSCPLCPNFYRRKGIKLPYKNISLPEFIKFFSSLKVLPKKVGLGVNNEPLINDNIFDIANFINNINKEIEITLSTNFTLSNKFKTETIVNSGIKNIVIGLDGIDQESYSKYRIGGNFDTVMNSIKKIQEYKKQKKLNFPKIIIIFIVFKHNENLIDKAKELFNSLEIPIFFRRTDMYNGFKDWFPVNFDQKNCNEYNKPIQHQHSEINTICIEPFFSTVIDAFGNVFPCCGEAVCDFIVGNIFKESFENIWNSKQMNNLRDCLQKKNNIKNIPCINCSVYKQDSNSIEIRI